MVLTFSVKDLVYDETPEACKLDEASPLYKLYKAVGERPRVATYVNNWELNRLETWSNKL
ncbi:hypothetical protein BDF19DRAFT_428019 [Syncephalis fuscata]|nr:hypothetical protein BDF19DRAFT_428019 [Syncephalis fuscata]